MHDQAMPARVTRRARILAYLEEHPGRTAFEICVAVDAQRPNGSVAGSVFQLLRDMERKGQVVATQEFRPQQGRQVNLWHLAPPGTPPQPTSPPSLGDARRYRARNGCTRAGRGPGGAARPCPSPPPSGACRIRRRAGLPILTCSSRCLMSPRIRPGPSARPALSGRIVWRWPGPVVSSSVSGVVLTWVPRQGRPGQRERQPGLHAASVAAARARRALHGDDSGAAAGAAADRPRAGPRRPADPGPDRTGRVLGAGPDPARRPAHWSGGSSSTAPPAGARSAKRPGPTSPVS